jgi:protein involved in polysaccharide export with SLBB domain
MRTLRFPALLIFAAAMPLAAAQTQQSQQPAQPVGRADPGYIIGVLDEVSVTVRSPILQPEFSAKNYRVQNDGTIILPALVNPVKISGMNVQGARDVIRKALIDSGQYQDPTVDVNVTDYRHTSVTVQGAVRGPGNVQMRADRMTIPDAISAAGGFLPGAGSRVWVRGGPNRPKPEPGILVDETGEVYRKDDILQGKVQDVTVYDGDTITVEVAPHYYVTGYVKNSSSEYNWEPGITLQRAIALAGGPSPDGALNRVSIDRLDPKTGVFTQAKLNKKDKMATLIEPNDVIKVPKKRM